MSDAVLIGKVNLELAHKSKDYIHTHPFRSKTS